MNAHSQRKTLAEAIRTGIASRDFYILPAPDQIPGCSGSRKEKLECARQFALKNGWGLTIHNGNGWLLFTANGSSAPEKLANGSSHQKNGDSEPGMRPLAQSSRSGSSVSSGTRWRTGGAQQLQ